MDSEKNDRWEDKIGIREIHETFWRARDFELTNLWQRSIFLTAILVLCFTAYGTVLSKIIESLSKEDLPFLILNLIAYGLSILGIILSILWIKVYSNIICLDYGKIDLLPLVRKRYSMYLFSYFIY